MRNPAVLGGSATHGPNWKVADIIPQPAASLSEEVRAALARLPSTFALEEET